MARDIFDHVQALLSSQPPSTSSQNGWNALISQLEAFGDVETPSISNGFHDDLEAPAPMPDILDYYKPLVTKPSENFARVDGHVSAPPTPSTPASRSAAALLQRLRRHVTEPASLQILGDLLSSERSSAEIQDAVMETIGFDEEGFELAGDVLSAGNRKAIASLLMPDSAPHGNGLNGHAETFHPGMNGSAGSASIGYTQEEANARIQAQLEESANRPLWTGTAVHTEKTDYPHVYTSSSGTANTSYGGRLALPLGTIRKETDIAQEVIIPPSNPVPPKTNERIIPVHELGPLASGCFPGYKTLNRVQSIVQPVAMGTNENMLICAPTGAGKTDVAIMAILRVLAQNLRSSATVPYGKDSVERSAFKVIYVAPMKALAAEITRKFAKRLAWLGVLVRELTGDMQLTRKEINETQIIVTTPEKWDVVTRKPTGEGELVSKVRLLIIDEVHLLNEDRGSVIETIVARTLRLVESSQSLIRIVGLSATLPNYVDVSDFLRVNRYQGLFFFDSSFRPVPLEQHFIGVRGKARSEQSKKNMDQMVFDKVAEMLAQGHQVMVFVHARKETVKTAEKLKEMAMAEGNTADFDPKTHPNFEFYRREMASSRNKEMKQLFDYGFGIHHAGMLRSDRNMMERMFESNCIKVLCCTATLAWGVNLPAHAVVIKGTQVYDAGKGSFVDLSILDVLQIFGRAGRPGYSTSGVGYICTTQDKLDHYLDAVLSQHPIESKFVPGMLDSMNAEISLGTIANMPEAIQWLGYTYLFVRMKRNPFNYGMAHDETADDPNLGSKRESLARGAGKRLLELRMVEFNEIDQTFRITDLGRIAAKYYLKHETIDVFNEFFKPKLTEADTLALLSRSTEFHQIQVRENEVEELKALMNDVFPCQVKGGTDTSPGKVNILLQAYICGAHIEDFALVSDTAYVAQNAARIIRALLEIALARHWASAAVVLASMSVSIEKRQWSYQNPLRQSKLQAVVLRNLEEYADDYTPSELSQMSAAEIGKMARLNDKHGAAILAVAKQFPSLEFAYQLKPISEDLLQIDVEVKRNFVWNQNLHGFSEPFYVWLEDEAGLTIYQWQHVLLRPSTTTVDLQFFVPIGVDRPEVITAKLLSDRWIGAEQSISIGLRDLVMPPKPDCRTILLDVDYLSVRSALRDQKAQNAYYQLFPVFNGVQSQAFWSLHHSDENVLLAAPNASGKSTIADVAAIRALADDPTGRVLYICSDRLDIGPTVDRLRSYAFSGTNLRIRRCVGFEDFQDFTTTGPNIGVTFPRALLDRITDSPMLLQEVRLVVLDDLQMLDEIYELAIIHVMEQISHSKTRIVALASSLRDAKDLANWLEVPPLGLYSFSPPDRGRSVNLITQSYALPHSATFMKALVKPVYAACKEGMQTSVIIFVPSAGQCRTVANDLVTQSGTEMDLNGFLAAGRGDVEPLARRLRDQAWVEPLLHGIGSFSDGQNSGDTAVMLELFAAGIIRVLIVPRDCCWKLPVQASTIVVMGAQYLEVQSAGKTFEANSERKLRNYSVQELVQMQGFAAKPPASSQLKLKANSDGGKFILMCQSEQVQAYRRFLNEGLPLESSLVKTLLREGSSRGLATLETILGEQPKRQDLMDFLSRSFLWRRMISNPTYYGSREGDENITMSRLADQFFAGHYEAFKAKQKSLKSPKDGQASEAKGGVMLEENAGGLPAEEDAKTVDEEKSDLIDLGAPGDLIELNNGHLP